ncbi:MAG: sporulation integral membrane protein YlbJ [Bacillota bacterium]|nr:sporulation integral membrane protein YlbJ [Bacillota bacterium]
MNTYSHRFVIFIVLFICVFMVVNPQETVNAAADGIKLWALIVLPALLPFFIVAELLVSLRFVNFLGILLEPLMRPIFRLPGCSSLVIVLGFTSGFPIGAVLTRRLYEKNMLNDNEAERLVSFTNNSSPLFIIGAIGIGMFSNATVGYILAASHYLANLCVGLLWRWRSPQIITPACTNTTLLHNAVASLSEEPPEGLGQLMGDAIKNSLNNVLAVGGFIILFSVLTKMFSICGFMDILAVSLQKLFFCIPISYPLAYGLSTGIFELTLGAKAIASTFCTDLDTQIIAVSALLGWSGLSIIAQVMSIVAGMPVRFSFYLTSRCIQLLLSCGFSFLFIKTLFAGSLPIFSDSLTMNKILYAVNAWEISFYCMIVGFACIAFLLFVSMLVKR